MHPHRHRRAGVPLSTSVLLFCGLQIGCDAVPFLQPAAFTTTAAVLPDGASSRASPASFPSALGVDLPRQGEVAFEAALASASDVNVFSLGPAARGDRILVDVSGHAGLNTVAALFTSAGELIDANDDRAYYSGQVDPYVSVVLRDDEPGLLLSVAISHARYFASTAGRFSSGSYRVHIQRQTGAAFAPTPQVVWLEFGGGRNVRVAQEQPIDVPAFDAARIAPRFEGQEQLIRDRLVEKMRQDLEPFNAVVLRSDQDARPAGDYSTVYFGGFNSRFLGLADSVDSYNAAPRQKAVIFAETLGLFEALRPTPDDVAQALANVGAHELGHLLGLEHTADPNDLMAPAATAQQIFFIDAAYGSARLDPELFPVGSQNGPRQLTLALGERDDALLATLAGAPANARTKSGSATDLTAGPAASRVRQAPFVCRGSSFGVKARGTR